MGRNKKLEGSRGPNPLKLSLPRSAQNETLTPSSFLFYTPRKPSFDPHPSNSLYRPQPQKYLFSISHSFFRSSAGLSSAPVSDPLKMPLRAWLKSQSARRQKKPYTSFRTDASPPPLSRKNAPRLFTPNYSSPSSPRPPSRPVSPHTTSHRTSEATYLASSKKTSSIPPHTTLPLTPPESIHSEGQSWITYSESSLRGNGGCDVRLPRDSAGIGPVAFGGSTPRRGRSLARSRGRNSRAILTPPQTPTSSSSLLGNGDEGGDDNEGLYDHNNNYSNRDLHVYAPTPLDSDALCPLARRKEELVELFTLHGPVYGEEWRLRGAHDEIKKSRERPPTEDIELVNEELMNGYASGDEGYDEMWALLLEGG